MSTITEDFVWHKNFNSNNFHQTFPISSWSQEILVLFGISKTQSSIHIIHPLTVKVSKNSLSIASSDWPPNSHFLKDL